MILEKEILFSIIKEELEGVLKGTPFVLSEQFDKDEWVGLSYKDVAKQLRAAGVQSLKGKWWKKFKRSDPVRVKYRQWWKNRGRAGTKTLGKTAEPVAKNEPKAKEERASKRHEGAMWTKLTAEMKAKAVKNRSRFQKCCGIDPEPKEDILVSIKEGDFWYGMAKQEMDHIYSLAMKERAKTAKEEKKGK